MKRVSDILLAGQDGIVLPLAILAVAIGLLVVVPVAAVVATTARSQGDLLDATKSRYLAEAGVQAVVEDLVRGADGDPAALLDYLPPVVNFDSRVPFTTVTAQDSASSPTITTKRSKTFQVDQLMAIDGILLQGGIEELERKDNDAFELTGAGTLPPDAGYDTDPQKVSFELTSKQAPFSKVEEGQAKLTVQAWDESARLEVFVYNPDDHPVGGYASTPDFSRLLDHDHFQNHSNHSHDSTHDHHNDGPGDPGHEHHIGVDHHHHVDDLADGHDHHHDHEAHAHRHSHDSTGDDDGPEDSHGHDHSGDGDSDDSDLLHHHHEGADLHLHEPGDNHGHDHQNHNHDEDDWHHGDIDVSFFLSDADLDYVSVNKTLKIKVVATVYKDLEHHHVVHGDETAGDDDDDGPNSTHDHHHHWNHDDRPPFVLATDMAAFTFVGPVVAEHRFLGPSPVINHGTVASGSVSDTKLDDQSYYTIDSSDQGSNEKVELEVTSAPFGLTDLETLSVPITLRADEHDDVRVEVFVFNPDASGTGSNGFRNTPQLKKDIGARDIDRTMALAVSSEDLSYVNGLTVKQLKLKVKITGDDDDFSVQLDRIAFIATSSAPPSGLLTGATHQYINPGATDPGVTDPDLATLPAGTSYVTQLRNVHPGPLSVNWAFEAVPNASRSAHDDSDLLTVRVFRGLVVDDGKLVLPGRYTHGSDDDDDDRPFEDDNDGNDLVGKAHVHPYHGEASLQTGLFEVDSGLYTIIFSNGAGDHDDDPENPTITAQAFAPSGTTADTWIFAASHRDYLVRSEIGNLGLTSVVRQFPGPQGPLPWSPKSVPSVPNLVVIKS